MKPIYLKMTAFGPYPDVVELNFEKDLKQDIFVVTGPTGAGKTTIYDAICYGLYGKTSGKKRTVSELRSHFAGIDSPLTEVEFIFEVGGNRYYIKRRPSQMRKAKRGNGEVKENSYVEFKNISSGEESITGETEVEGKIEDILGLNLDQFRKIVMIPQGDFREFLDSKTDDKIKILRKIFGTSYYQKIQEQLNENAKELYNEISDIEKEIEIIMKGIKRDSNSELDIKLENKVPTQDIIETLKNHIKYEKEEEYKYQEEQIELEKMYKKIENNLNIGISINTKFKDREDNLKQLRELELKKDTIDEMKHKYLSGSKALNIIDTEKDLLQEQEELENLLKNKLECEKYLDNIVKNFEHIEIEYNKIEANEHIFNEKNNELNRLINYIEDVKSIENRTNNISKLKDELKNCIAENDSNKNRLVQLKDETKNLTTLSIELERKKGEAKDLQQKKELYNGIREELLDLHDNVKELYSLNEKDKIIIDKFNKLQKEKDALNKAYDNKYEIFMNSAAIIVAKTLQEGVGCPVCGSVHHPNPKIVKENIPTKEELTNLRSKIEGKEKEINKLKDDRFNLNKSLVKNKSDIDNIFKKLVANSIFDEKEDIYNYTEVIIPKGLWIRKELLEIEEKLNTLKKDINRLTITVKELDEKKLSIDNYDKLVEDGNKTINEIEKSIAVEEENLKSILTNVPTQYQNLNILNDSINKLTEEIKKIKEIIIDTRKQYDDTKIDIAKHKEKHSFLINSIDKSNKQVYKLSNKLNNFIKDNFKDIDDYNKSKISETELKDMKVEIDQYDQLVNAINKIINDLNEELKNLEIVDVEKLRSEKESLKQKIENLLKSINNLIRDIKDNAQILQDIESNYNLIKDKENEYKVLAELSKLANGSIQNKVTLETFVLASYFEDVIFEANKRLEKITNKQYYLLRKDEVGGKGKKGLELDVYDTNTCKTRSVSSLFGGETFKVSLALALGLSDVVQHNTGGIQLDTMFIDEGFGTLDSESLEHAIDILIELQDHGRIIGVISHVNELKERIPAKLVVEKTPNGSTAKFIN